MAKIEKLNRYQLLIESIFFENYTNGVTEFLFARQDIETKADNLNVKLPRNLGDVVYSVRYRTALPAKILETQPDGQEWIIEGAGRAKYRFRLVTTTRVVPRDDLIKIEIPDATPEVIRAYALDDEQALLAIVRYNRLIDSRP